MDPSLYEAFFGNISPSQNFSGNGTVGNPGVSDFPSFDYGIFTGGGQSGVNVSNRSAPNIPSTGGGGGGQESESGNLALNVFRIIVCVLGIIGNLLVIFVILVLAEYKKAVTHWYVLQLAIADTIFLLCIPFRVVEDVNDSWTFSVGLCKAKETILFLNYYSSILFLMVMSIDRYIAVCHGFSDRLQKFRTPFASGVITISMWAIALCMCVPVMLYSGVHGQEPTCKCQYQFPKHVDPEATCLADNLKRGSEMFNLCVNLNSGQEKVPNCRPIRKTTGNQPREPVIPFPNISAHFPAQFTVEDLKSDNLFGVEEEIAQLTDKTIAPQSQLNVGCHYIGQSEGFIAFIVFNFVVMFLIPLIIMSVCYSLIIRKLRSMRMPSDSNAAESSGNSSTGDGKKRVKSAASAKDSRNRTRVTIMCAALVIVFVVCWVPYHSVHLAKIRGIAGKETSYCNTLFSAVSLMAYINSAINPYLYNFIGTRFGKRLRQVKETKAAKAIVSYTTGKQKHDTGRDRSELAGKGAKSHGKSQANESETKPTQLQKDIHSNDNLASVEVYTGPSGPRRTPFKTPTKNDHQEAQSTTKPSDTPTEAPETPEQ